MRTGLSFNQVAGILERSVTSPLTTSPIIPYNKVNTQYPLFSQKRPITARLKVRVLPGEPTKNTPVREHKERAKNVEKPRERERAKSQEKPTRQERAIRYEKPRRRERAV